jgi:hypothetical protein
MKGFKLVPFSQDNADRVLGWRNSEKIRSNMLDDSVIEHSAHKKFLAVLAEDDSMAYFVVEFKGAPVATIYFTGLGSDKVTWGCYIGSEKTIPGLFVAIVVIAVKYSFSLPTTRILRSEVAVYNSNPIKLNRFLGIPETSRFSRSTRTGREVEFIEYCLTSEELNGVLAKAEKVMPSSVKQSCEEFRLER